jgi:hypothetical protein
MSDEIPADNPILFLVQRGDDALRSAETLIEMGLVYSSACSQIMDQNLSLGIKTDRDTGSSDTGACYPLHFAIVPFLLVTQLPLRNVMARQAPAWRLSLQAGACKADPLPSWSLVTKVKNT